jgi:hypothetical protein
MSHSRPVVALIGVGILGIACVGLGAGATFTDATHSLQTISSGTIDVTLDGGAYSTGNGSKTITFADFLLNGSSFKTALMPITMKNNGTIAANYVYFNITTQLPAVASAADTALRDQLNVCIWSPTDTSGSMMFDGPVSAFDASPGGKGLDLTGGSLQPQATDSYSVEFYAGNVSTKCGQSGYGALSQDAQGGSVATSVDITYEG